MTGRGDENPQEVDSDKWCGKKQHRQPSEGKTRVILTNN